MNVKYKTAIVKKIEQGPRGFPGAKAMSSGVSSWNELSDRPVNVSYWTNDAGYLTATHLSDFNHGNIAHGETAYGWGNHAEAGYAPLANPSFTGEVAINGTCDLKASPDSPWYGYSIGTTGVGGGGWARAFRFHQRSSGNSLAGYGAAGDEDGLSYLWIGGEYNDYGIAVYPDGATELNYNNSKKLETTNTGILVTGELKGTSLNTANWSFEESGNDLLIKRGSTLLFKLYSTGKLEAEDNIKGGVVF